MSLHSNRATLSLLNMTKNMLAKGIEIRRITKTSAMLIMSGLSENDISQDILEKCIESQKPDGGFIGISDGIWNIKFLDYYPKYKYQRNLAISWIENNKGDGYGFGRSSRDVHRIPVTGLALYLIPELVSREHLEWLALTWIGEKNSLTYKAAYTLLALAANNVYVINRTNLIEETAEWLVSQQEPNGGFAPWLNHPVGPNVFCTSVAAISLASLNNSDYFNCICKAYEYLCKTQLKSGIWPYHEIEDGASWGLYALSVIEKYLEVV